MSTPFLGEVWIFSFGFAPKGWVTCNGQVLPINQYQALFSLLGTTYGGNGQTTFALPNLQGRVPLHVGNGFLQGGIGGEETHTISVEETPAHTHTVTGSSAAADQSVNAGTVWAKAPGAYAATPGLAMSAGAIAADRRQPAT